MTDYVVPVLTVAGASVVGYILYNHISRLTMMNRIETNLRDLRAHVKKVTDELLNLKESELPQAKDVDVDMCNVDPEDDKKD